MKLLYLTFVLLSSYAFSNAFNDETYLAHIYNILDKANKQKTLSNGEIYMLLDSYNYEQNNVELSEYRAFGITSIVLNHKNCRKLLKQLKNNQDFITEFLCIDMLFVKKKEKEDIINNINQVSGFKDIKSKIFLLLDKYN